MNDGIDSPIARVTSAVTGRAVRYGATCWRAHALEIDQSAKYETEAILHELCHWIAATPAERAMYNLGLLDIRRAWREAEACAIQIWIEDAAGVELTSSYVAPRTRLRVEYANCRGHFRERAAGKLALFDDEHPGAIRDIIRAIQGHDG